MMKKELLHRILKYLLMALIIVVCALILKPNITAYAKHQDKLENMRTEISELEAERAQLDEKAQALENEDPELIERLAREKLHLRKPDETIFQFEKKQ
jgi:cell division protein FtsB